MFLVLTVLAGWLGFSGLAGIAASSVVMLPFRALRGASALGDVFERTYARAGEGCYTKRSDNVLRYFTLERPVMVDWIVEGVAGESWPMPRKQALAKYELA